MQGQGTGDEMGRTARVGEVVACAYRHCLALTRAQNYDFFARRRQVYLPFLQLGNEKSRRKVGFGEVWPFRYERTRGFIGHWDGLKPLAPFSIGISRSLHTTPPPLWALERHLWAFNHLRSHSHTHTNTNYRSAPRNIIHGNYSGRFSLKSNVPHVACNVWLRENGNQKYVSRFNFSSSGPKTKRAGPLCDGSALSVCKGEGHPCERAPFPFLGCWIISCSLRCCPSWVRRALR